MFTRIALYATLGLVLDALGHPWNTWQFWSVLGLFWAADVLARREGHQLGLVVGVDAYIRMTPEQQADIQRKIKEVRGND